MILKASAYIGILCWLASATAFTYHPLVTTGTTTPREISGSPHFGVASNDQSDPVFGIEEEVISPQIATAAIENAPPGTTLSQQLQTNQNDIRVWTVRLITREDKRYLHKISCVLFCLSGAFILGSGIASSPSALFAEIPDFLAFPVYVFALSSVVQGMSSIEMANSHRRTDTGAREGFTRSSYNIMTLGLLTFWGSPFCLEIFDQRGYSELLFLPLAFLSMHSQTLQDGKLLGIPAALKSRMKTKIAGLQMKFIVFMKLRRTFSHC